MMLNYRDDVYTHHTLLIEHFVVIIAMFSSFVFESDGLDLLSGSHRRYSDAEVLHSQL